MAPLLPATSPRDLPSHRVGNQRWNSCLMLGLLTALVTTLWGAGALGPLSEPGRYGPDGFWRPDRTRDLGTRGGQIRGDAKAGVFDHAVWLTREGSTNAIAALDLPDLNPRRTARAFDVQFDLLLVSQDEKPTGGLCVAFARRDDDLPIDPPAVPKAGLAVRFDLHHRDSNPASIDILIDGRVVASHGVRFEPRRRRFKTVNIRWDADGIDLQFGGATIFQDRPVAFRPRVGHRFSFLGYAGTAGTQAALDNLWVQTRESRARTDLGVILSEVVPNPTRGVKDEDLKLVDWIELHNASGDAMDLAGYVLRLTRDGHDTVWTFPRWHIGPLDYGVVFASGKDRHHAGATHTNFRLPREGAVLTLFDPKGEPLSSLSYSDASPGSAVGWIDYGGAAGFLAHPTPGAPNTGPLASHAQAPAPSISHGGGTLTEPVQVTIDTDRAPAGAVIHFSTDGRAPTQDSPVYRRPLTISHTTTLRAAVFAEGHLASPITQRSFVFLGPDVAAFHSNLPILIADSAGVHVDADCSPFDHRDNHPVFCALFEPGPADARARTTAPPSLSNHGAMRVRGHSSALQFPKKQYAWEIQDARGDDLDASLLGLPADSDWVLSAPYSDKTLMRNVLAYTAGRICNGPQGAPRTRYIELFFNQDGDEVTMADYQGVYVLTEKIKRGEGRLDLAGLNETITDPDRVTGGYVFKFDKGADWDPRIRTGVYGLRASIVEPDRLNLAQSRYLSGYLTDFERSLKPSLWSHPSQGYRCFIDADSFLLMDWMVEIFYELDGWWLSTYFTKDRGGKLRAMPLWDFNLAMGNSHHAPGYDARGWYRDAGIVQRHPWFHGLLADPAMRTRSWELYTRLRQDELSDTRITTYIADLAAFLEEAAARNFKRWPILGESVWPHALGARQRTTYRAEVEFLHGWLMRRLAWIDSQAPGQPGRGAPAPGPRPRR